MVSDTIASIEKYQDTITRAGAIKRFVAEKVNNLQPGQWFQIEDGLKVILLESCNYNEGIMETHQQNFDVHVTLTGCDRVHVTHFNKLALEKEYDHPQDYALWKGIQQEAFNLKPMSFLFLAPHEAHNNTFVEDGTRKLVFKIKV